MTEEEMKRLAALARQDYSIADTLRTILEANKDVELQDRPELHLIPEDFSPDLLDSMEKPTAEMEEAAEAIPDSEILDEMMKLIGMDETETKTLVEAEKEITEESAEVDDSDGFDIMQLLMDQVKQGNEVNSIDLMQQYGENTTEVSLDELIKYNKQH